ncbi:MAG: c-type cytochrome [Planctomycetota bacterium]
MTTPEPFSRCLRALLRVDRPSLLAAFGLLLVLAAGLPRVGPAQIPDEFHNLQVLPEEIEKPRLVGIMRGFAMGLGVRCWYCHVGEEGKPFSDFDFESDEKLTKKKARFMLEMTRHLNDERLPGLTEVGERADPAVRLTCYTCHRGRPVPRTLEEEIGHVIAEEGVAAAAARYRELRDEFYGQGAFNFGEFTLLNVAESLGGDGRVEDGIEIVKLNLEFFPESGFSYFALGEGYRMLGDTAEAITAYEKAQELVPGNPMIERRLQELKAAAEEGSG